MTRRDDDPRRRLSRPRVPGEPTDPVALGDAAAMVGAELGLADPLVFSRIVAAWAELVGEMVAAHSRVRAVRNGVIEVVVDSPAWASEFRYLESELVTRAAGLVGDGAITGVRAVVEGPTPGAGGRPDGEGGRRAGEPPR